MAFLDGTKLGAHANKYKFVWKPTRFHERLDGKIVALLSEFGIDAGHGGGKLLSSEEIGEYVVRVERILAGGNRHAAYQIQLIVCGGIVAEYLVDQNRNDAYSAVPILRKYRIFYGSHPQRLVADAGYGLPGLYAYCGENGIEAYVKYQD